MEDSDIKAGSVVKITTGDPKTSGEFVVLDVNTLDPVAKAIAKLREDIADRSFSGRNPQLGKMVKCQICRLRHRSSIVCKENVIVSTAQTRKGVYGAAAFAKKRVHPHKRGPLPRGER
jgi:hypothetical protein